MTHKKEDLTPYSLSGSFGKTSSTIFRDTFKRETPSLGITVDGKPMQWTYRMLVEIWLYRFTYEVGWRVSGISFPYWWVGKEPRGRGGPPVVLVEGEKIGDSNWVIGGRCEDLVHLKSQRHRQLVGSGDETVHRVILRHESLVGYVER